MARTKVRIKGTTKVVPSKSKRHVKPKYSSGVGGLLTEKIAITVKKGKETNKTGKVKK